MLITFISDLKIPHRLGKCLKIFLLTETSGPRFILIVSKDYH